MARRTETFTLDVHHDGGDGYWAEVVELPGCFATGFTMAELYDGVAEAVGMYLSEPGRQVTATIDDEVSTEKHVFELVDA